MSYPESNTPTAVSAGASAPSETSNERRDRRGKGKKARRTKGTTFREPKFSGHTEELKDEVYDLTYNMSDQYTATTIAISEHVRRTYNNESAVKTSIEELTALVLVLPADSVAPNVLELRI